MERMSKWCWEALCVLQRRAADTDLYRACGLFPPLAPPRPAAQPRRPHSIDNGSTD